MRGSSRVEMTAGKTCLSARSCDGRRRWSRSAGIALIERWRLIDSFELAVVAHVYDACRVLTVFLFFSQSAYITLYIPRLLARYLKKKYPVSVLRGGTMCRFQLRFCYLFPTNKLLLAPHSLAICSFSFIIDIIRAPPGYSMQCLYLI